MLKVTLLLVSLLIMGVSCQFTAAEVNQIFQKWKSSYHRNYDNSEQESYRLSVFCDNLVRIDELKSQYPEVQWKLNKFADLSKQEFETMYFSQVQENTQQLRKVKKVQNMKVMAPAPTSYDWTTQGIVNKVKDQGSCGAQWAFSTIASIESQFAKVYGQLYDLSEQELIDCVTSNEGCNGGAYTTALTFLQSYGGVEDTASYPYKAEKKTCNFNETLVKVKVESYQNTESGNEEAMADYLYNIGPLAVSMHAFELQFYNSGVYDPLLCSKRDKNLKHQVVAVGYGVDGDKNYWKMRNSWGEDWGESGYYLLIRGSNKCGVADEATSVFVKQP